MTRRPQYSWVRLLVILVTIEYLICAAVIDDSVLQVVWALEAALFALGGLVLISIGRR